MNRELALLGGIGLGATVMYMVDPDRGKRRRALMRDKLARATHKVPDAVSATARDISNRVRGLTAEAASAFSNEEVSDEVLVARVRSKLGRIVSHPSSIEVAANQGRVVLSGPILAHETNDLLTCIRAVPGVREVDNLLDVHKQAGDVPGLQGGEPRSGDRFDLMQENWSPTSRLLAGAAGGALAVYGLSRRDPLSLSLGAIGIGLIARSVTNLEMKRLVGLGAGRRAVEIQKTINIAAPVEQVYDFWKNFENFPSVMSNVQEVRDNGNGTSHWVVAGPMGVPVEWDAVITRDVPNELLAWKSVEGASVESAGIVHFGRNEDGTTSVQVKLSYNPPAGAIGHAIAALFGSDPKTEMDADLMRMKSLIETGMQPHDAAERKSPKAREATAT
ncbi:MAG: SRPBCC family protein [Pyrinomonadaceae bacterium]